MRIALVVVLAVVALVPAAALAQSENKAAADAAFKRGKQLIDAGDTAAACTEFQRSQELDPQLGTQYNLALCFEKLGKLASAYGELVELAEKDSNARRKADSKKRAAALRPRLTQLNLIVTDPAPSLTVRRDDLDVTLLVGVTTPVDAGTYVFRAEAPGRVTWEQEVDLSAEGATITVEIPALEPVPEPVPVPDPDPVTEEPAPAPVPVPEPGQGRGRKLLGMGLTGGGVVLAGVGLVFGFQALSLTSDAEDQCGGSLDPCSGDVLEAGDLIDDARGKAMLSNVFVGAGVIAATAGVILWLTAPDGGGERATSVVPMVGGDAVGLAFDGQF